MKLILSLVGLMLALSSPSSGSGGQRVLVLLDNLAIKESHSIFFKTLLDIGLEVNFKVADDSTIVLKKFGSFLYDHLVIFSPTVEEFGGTLSVESIIEFIDNGGNVLVAGSSNTGDILRELASECGFEADEEGTSIIDHLNFDLKDSGKHTLVVSNPDNLIKSEAIVGAGKIAPVLYQGTGLIADRSNPLVLEILSASSSAYSHNPDTLISEYPHATGKNTLMIAGLQARNNARVVFSGSLDFFSDQFFNNAVESSDGKTKAAKSGNQDLAKALSRWCFKQSGVLRVVNVDHRLATDLKNPPPSSYTIKDEVIYTIDIEEYKDGKWAPYTANDVQLEFVRIDPFVRMTMTPKNGRFEAKFTIPDVYGVYQFKVDYVRTGLTRLYSATQYSVRPLRHDQYERFILSASPYYTSSFSMMIGVFIFSFVFLHFKEEPAKTKSE